MNVSNCLDAQSMDNILARDVPMVGEGVEGGYRYVSKLNLDYR